MNINTRNVINKIINLFLIEDFTFTAKYESDILTYKIAMQFDKNINKALPLLEKLSDFFKQANVIYTVSLVRQLLSITIKDK